MEDTWFSRDLPVLDAIVRYFDETDEPLQAGIPTEQTFAEITRRDVGEVHRAVRQLQQSYVVVQDGGLGESMIMGVTDEARRAVGLWPTPESVVEQIARGLLEAADREPDEQKRSRLRALGEGLLGFGKDVAANAVANAAMLPFTGG
jgi:hypothetical protein